MMVRPERRRSKTIGGTLLGLALVTSGVWALRSAASPSRSQTPKPSSATPLSIDTGPIVAELTRVEMRLMMAEQRIGELEREKPSPAVGSARPTSDERPDNVDAPGNNAGSALTEEERRAHVNAAFTAETADPSWKPEASVRSTLNELLPKGASVASIECRRSLCRVETSHPNAESQRSYVQAVGLPGPTQASRPFAGALFDEGTPSADGREVRSVTYFTRPGFELP
jgi:hypothetical protein